MEKEYYDFMKKWNIKHNMTSFYGSDKKDFLKEWRKNKKLIDVKNEPYMIIKEEPIKEEPKKEEPKKIKIKVKKDTNYKKELESMGAEDVNIKKEEPKKIKIKVKKEEPMNEEQKKIKLKLNKRFY